MGKKSMNWNWGKFWLIMGISIVIIYAIMLLMVFKNALCAEPHIVTCTVELPPACKSAKFQDNGQVWQDNCLVLLQAQRDRCTEERLQSINEKDAGGTVKSEAP